MDNVNGMNIKLINEMGDKPSIYAILMAGGRGSRLGGEPKQFRLLNGKPMILYSLITLYGLGAFKRIIIPVPEEFVNRMNSILNEHKEELGSLDMIDVIPGGSERWESLDIAISHIDKKYGIEDGDIALTHDAARPFVTVDMIERSILGARETGAATCAVPATDTITSSPGGKEIGTILDRDVIYNIQTPQTFIINLYQQARSTPMMDEEYIKSVTDIAGLFRYGKLPVSIVPGNRWNIKITYEEDFGIAEGIIKLSAK